jgi:hypothetical protein
VPAPEKYVFTNECVPSPHVPIAGWKVARQLATPSHHLMVLIFFGSRDAFIDSHRFLVPGQELS